MEEKALAIFRLRGDQLGVATLLNSRGLSAYDVGDYDQAETLLEEALSLGRSLGSWQSVAYVLNNLALVAHERCDYDRAEALQAEALDLMRSLGDVDGMASCLENFAIFTQAQNQLVRAMRLYGAADALRARIGAPGRPNDREFNERYMAEARAQLGDDAFVAAYGEGEAMSLEEAIAHALGEDRNRL
jgi:tetratricopeptide (TPR) repeat protein